MERENATVWKAVLLALRSKGLPVSRWQAVLPDALHSIRSLLCTATNATPHERMFVFPRKSSSGTSLPSWLTSPGPVLLQKHVRTHKSDPLVETVRHLHANPQYAYVAYRDGREDTVSIRDLAPAGIMSHDPTPMTPIVVHDVFIPECGTPEPREQSLYTRQSDGATDRITGPGSTSDSPPRSPVPPPQLTLRRSQRRIKPPERLDL